MHGHGLGAAQKVEHYEISEYGTAHCLARQIGEREDVHLLYASCALVKGYAESPRLHGLEHRDQMRSVDAGQSTSAESLHNLKIRSFTFRTAEFGKEFQTRLRRPTRFAGWALCSSSPGYKMKDQGDHR
jgi:hypothetical protein